MSSTEIFQVDAFARGPFTGNPAAVCFLEDAKPESWMQSVATEMNLSETAYVRSADPTRGAKAFHLQWFTPVREVDLCGHATLATAHVLRESGRVATGEPIVFHTRSGDLRAQTLDEQVEMDFPAVPTRPVTLPEGVRATLGVAPVHCELTTGAREGNFVVELASEAAVRAVEPSFQELARAHDGGVIVTARADAADHDFVSRYFVPALGVDEDPVTGSAHCSLAPYWATRLERTSLVGYQASARGGEVRTRVDGDRVHLAGHATTVFRGVLAV